MAYAVVHLPNGHDLTILPVFGGLFFKANELNVHRGGFPPGWTVILQSEDYQDEHEEHSNSGDAENHGEHKRHHHIHRFKRPTLQNDNLFISSISNPSNNDFKPPASPTRQIAMMLWATLYWYFHQPEPPLYLTTDASKSTPDAGKPKGDWRINIKREGIFRGRNLLQKLERMGLITSEDSTVGCNFSESAAAGWEEMFVSRRSFWQLSARLFLFSLSPVSGLSTGSPYGSRPNSPIRNSDHHRSHSPDRTGHLISTGLWAPNTPGPFASGSHLPTYYPPPPLQYTMTNGVRHPIRPKPPRQGETFYLRYIPSMEQYLSFRVASLNDKPVAYFGPLLSSSESSESASNRTISPIPPHMLPSSTPSTTSDVEEGVDTARLTDIQLLHKWMNESRVSNFWGVSGPTSIQEAFLKDSLESRHSFPAIGCWDGTPFGYFEIYWVKEDILGKHLNAGEANDFDRGVHVLVGEAKYRGQHRVVCWISALAHWALTADNRTNNVVLEPRIDNERFIQHLQDAGFSKEKEITFPHKQAVYMRMRREEFDGPAL